MALPDLPPSHSAILARWRSHHDHLPLPGAWWASSRQVIASCMVGHTDVDLSCEFRHWVTGFSLVHARTRPLGALQDSLEEVDHPFTVAAPTTPRDWMTHELLVASLTAHVRAPIDGQVSPGCTLDDRILL